MLILGSSKTRLSLKPFRGLQTHLRTDCFADASISVKSQFDSIAKLATPEQAALSIVGESGWPTGSFSKSKHGDDGGVANLMIFLKQLLCQTPQLPVFFFEGFDEPVGPLTCFASVQLIIELQWKASSGADGQQGESCMPSATPSVTHHHA